MEVSGRLALPAGLRAFASYSFLDATYQSTVLLASALPEPDSARPGDTFPLSPRHRGTIGIGATRVIKTSVLDGELSLRAVSSQYLRGDDANREQPLPGYGVVDLRMTLEHERFAVSASVTNLLDRRYETFGIFALNPKGPLVGPRPAEPTLERFLNPGYPRALTLSVRAKL